MADCAKTEYQVRPQKRRDVSDTFGKKAMLIFLQPRLNVYVLCDLQNRNIKKNIKKNIANA